MSTARTLILASALLLLVPAMSAAQQNATETQQNATLQDILDTLPLRTPPPDLEEETFEPAMLMECFCRRVLAAVTCKKPAEYNFVREVNSVYLFSSYYASSPEDFYCHAQQGRVLLSSSPWGKMRITIGYEVDTDTRCVLSDIGGTMCDKAVRVRCCR